MEYSGKKWEKKRNYILRRDRYMCQECKRYGRLISGRVVHHVFPIEIYPKEAFNNCNLITLCDKCHNKMHDRDSHKLTRKGKELQRRIKLRFGDRLPPL